MLNGEDKHLTPDPATLEHDPPEESIGETQEELIESFSFFDNWEDRYQYLIDMGRKLPDFPESWQQDAYKVRGCMSQVWVIPHKEDERLYFHATSDAIIVRGLVALLLKVYSGRRPEEIVSTPPDFIEKIGLREHLSPTRSNGLASALDTMKAHAKAAMGEA